jgi:hypothetical protein
MLEVTLGYLWSLTLGRRGGVSMRSLALAVKIADLVASAKRRQVPMDVASNADRLMKDHPESEASHSEIAEILRDESAALGLIAAN